MLEEKEADTNVFLFLHLFPLFQFDVTSCSPVPSGMNNLSLVAELLSQAEWAVLKTPDCGHAVHQRLHRSLGRLHTITGELDAALFDFGNDV